MVSCSRTRRIPASPDFYFEIAEQVRNDTLFRWGLRHEAAMTKQLNLSP